MQMTGDYERDFALRLTQLRQQKDVSAREMSLAIGQNPGYINNIECGRAFPSMSLFFIICDYLRVSPAEFFDLGRKDPMRREALDRALNRLTDDQLAHVGFIVQELTK